MTTHLYSNSTPPRRTLTRRMAGGLAALALTAALAGCGGRAAHRQAPIGGTTQQTTSAPSTTSTSSGTSATGASNTSNTSSSAGNGSAAQQLNTADQQMQNALPSLDSTQDSANNNWSSQYPETQP